MAAVKVPAAGPIKPAVPVNVGKSGPFGQLLLPLSLPEFRGTSNPLHAPGGPYSMRKLF